MFCIQCGQQIPDGSTFCPKCGAKQPVQHGQPAAQAQPMTQQNSFQAASGNPNGFPETSFYGRTITVTDKKQFTEAVKQKYDTIIVEGPFASDIAKQLKNAETGNIASDVAIAAGIFLFWPAAVGGIAGKMLTKEMKKYQVYSVEPNKVIVTRKE